MSKTLRFILFSIAGVLICAATQAQQRYTTSVYHLSGYNLNAAYAGLEECIQANIQQKNQWTGVDGAPVNTAFQLHHRVFKTIGAGLQFNRWQAGLLTNTQIGVSLAQHQAIGESGTLSLSATAGYNQYALSSDDIVAFQADALMAQQNFMDNGFFADLGVLYTSNNLQIGIAAPRLLRSDMVFETTPEATFNVANYFTVHGNYLVDLNENLSLTPHLVYRTLPNAGGIIDLMASLKLKEQIGLSLGFRNRSGILAGLDYSYNDLLLFGYSYDAGISNLAGISGGSHEIMLAIKICREKPPKEEKVEKQEPAPEPIPEPLFANITVVDASTGKAINNMEITTKTDTTITAITNETGMIKREVQNGATLGISCQNRHYDLVEQNIEIPQTMEKDTTLTIKANHKTPSFFGTITDADTKAPISGVKVKLANDIESYDAITNEKGNFTIQLPQKEIADKLNYTASFSKKGFVSITDTLITTVKGYDPKDLMEELEKEIVLESFTEGKDVAKLINLNPIYFDLGKYDINEASSLELEKVIKVMTENPTMEIEIGAHTDCRGGETLNRNLSDKRAKAAAEYIKAKIENPERIAGKGYGESQPLSDCSCNSCSDEEHAKNRRIEFKIIKME